MTFWPHPVTCCPHCGRRGDRASGVNTTDRPEADCISVCFGCEKVSLYTADLQLRKLTAAEERELSAKYRAEVRDAVTQIRRAKRGRR